MIQSFDAGKSAKNAVLMVDAEHDIQCALATRLKDAGFEFLTATRGHDALRILAARRVSLVVIDPKLIDMNGVKLGELIREKSEAPFLFLTNGSTQKYKAVALAVGAINILSKATHPDDLVTQIQLALRNASEIGDSRKMAERLKRKLGRSEKCETLIGAYTEIWCEDRETVKRTLISFARRNNTTLDRLADQYTECSQEASKIREEYGERLESIQPEIINQLNIFHATSNKKSKFVPLLMSAGRRHLVRITESQ